MSYDLHVATHERPDRALLEEFAGERGALVSGDFESGLEILRKGSRVPLTVDGPHAVEVDDLDEALAAVVLAPRWLIGISIPYAAARADFALGRAFARHIAEACQGAALDRQEHGLLWPRGRVTRFRAPAREELIAVVEMCWVLRPNAKADVGRHYLQVAALHTPEALPRRYGAFEPPQHRFEEGGEDEFAAVWEAERDLGHSLYWNATAPFFGGAVSFPPRRADVDRAATQLSLSLDGRAFEDDAWLTTAVALFERIAHELDALYGAAYVERGITVNRNRLWYGPESETTADFTLLRGSFPGIPRQPTWLSWSGSAYGARLGTPGKPTFVRAAHSPLDALPDPEIPDELLFRSREEPADWVPRP